MFVCLFYSFVLTVRVLNKTALYVRRFGAGYVAAKCLVFVVSSCLLFIFVFPYLVASVSSHV